MNTLTSEVAVANKVKAVGARFDAESVYIRLSDGREIGLPLSHPRLGWLAHATPEARRQYEITPDGQMIMWWELNDGGDGFEVAHLLDPRSLS